MLVLLYCFIKFWKKFLNFYVYLLYEGIVYDFVLLIGCNVLFWFNKIEFYLIFFMSEIDFNVFYMYVLMLILEIVWVIIFIIFYCVFIDCGLKYLGGRWVKVWKICFVGKVW